MGNMNITVPKDEFINKPPEERDWMLFQGILHINDHGCNYSRKTYRRLYGIAAITGLIGGFLATVGRIVSKRFDLF